MYVKKNFWLWITVLTLALPLLLIGTAAASIKYFSDGTVQNVTTGEWELSDPGLCYVKDSATTGDIVPAADRTACRALVSSVDNQADCETADATHPTYRGRWSSGVCTGNVVYLTAYDGGAREGCLRCHDGMGVGPAAVKKSYLKTGHKNMLRKVNVGTPHLGPDGLAYTGDGTNTFSWIAGTMTSPTGTTYDLLWIYGDWIAPVPRAAYLNPTANTTYSCSKCHATGTSIDSAVTTTKEPALYLETRYGVGNGVNKIGSGNGQINLKLDVTGYLSDVYASWDQWGIQCSRCHNSAESSLKTEETCTNAGYAWHASSHGNYCEEVDPERSKWNPDIVGGVVTGGHHHEPTTGPGIVRLCGECHRQESGGLPLTWVGSNNGTPWNKGLGDHAESVIAGVSHGHPSVAVSHNYMNVFLNSPHSMFTGTYGQITDIANYGSTFMKAAPDGLGKNGCLGCHNIHESLVVEGHEPFENECTDCHSATIPDGKSPQITISGINHPGGVGTPLEHVNEHPSSACESCHMPGGLHFFRINSDPNYETATLANMLHPEYTTKNACTGAGYLWDTDAGCYEYAPDNTAADGSYNQAVWLDVDLACGQCHGGGASEATMPGSLAPGAPYKTKAILAAIAKTMHSVNKEAPVIGSDPYTHDPADGKGMTVLLQDRSSGDGAEVKIFWGDGTVETGVPGQLFTHKYTRAKTYTVSHSVYNGLLSDSEMLKVTVPKTIWIGGLVSNITGTVTAQGKDASKPVTLILKYNGHTKKRITVAAGGTFSFEGVRPITNGEYTIKAYKYHVLFTPAIVSAGTPTQNKWVGTINAEWQQFK